MGRGPVPALRRPLQVRETALIAADGRDIDISVWVMRDVLSGDCNFSQFSLITDMCYNISEF